jgi:hypothetical protein
MAAETVRADPESKDPPVKELLEVLVLYEDLGTALRAKRSLDLLPEQLAGEVGRGTRLWRLDLLRQPMLAEQAAIEAAAADLIILSLHSRPELPGKLQNWLNRWRDLKEHRPYALAALLDPQPVHRADENPMMARLKQFAAAADTDFFCGFCDGPITRSNASTGGTATPGHGPAT